MHHAHDIRSTTIGWLADERAVRAARPGGGGGRHGGARVGFPGFGPPRGPRARRGDVRAALLVLLAEEPRNGYQLMQEIEQRSDGVWRPSPGSVYPALQQLEDEGLVASRPASAGKAYALTDAGRAHVEEHARRARRPVGRRQGRRRRGRLGADGRDAPDRHGALPAHALGHRGPAGGGQGRARRDPARALPDPRRGAGRRTPRRREAAEWPKGSASSTVRGQGPTSRSVLPMWGPALSRTFEYVEPPPRKASRCTAPSISSTPPNPTAAGAPPRERGPRGLDAPPPARRDPRRGLAPALQRTASPRALRPGWSRDSSRRPFRPRTAAAVLLSGARFPGGRRARCSPNAVAQRGLGLGGPPGRTTRSPARRRHVERRAERRQRAEQRSSRAERAQPQRRDQQLGRLDRRVVRPAR